MTGAAVRHVPALTPRPVFCVTAHERRDMRVAEDVCAGRFAFAGVARRLGIEPHWLAADLPADDEWRIEWSKFYYGRDLAHAFALTGEHRFLDAWESLVGSWIDRVPVGTDTSDVAGRRIQNWIYAWQDFAAAPAFAGLSDDLAGRLAESIAEQAAYVRAELSPERNHRTFELYALVLVALALFSVYGPRQRPDMAFNRFCEAAVRGEPITIYGNGEQTRDFTYVDDIVAATRAAAIAPAAPGHAYNVGGGSRVSLKHTLDVLADVSGRRLDIELEEREHGDVANTGADISRARADLGFEPSTSLEQGLLAEYEWMAARVGGARFSARPGGSAPAGRRRAALRVLPAEARG